MDTSSDEFCEAYDKLLRAGMLEPLRLASLPIENFTTLLKLAVGDGDLDEEALLKWLLLERDAAIPAQQMAIAVNAKNHILKRFQKKEK